jgi:hypothetical protein
VDTYVVRVWLPDRPGALGQVASRIGAVGGDVVGIDILERGGGSAIDELTVTLADGQLVDLLITEIRQVDGVAVEDVRRIEADRPDAGTAGLLVASRLVAAEASGRIDVFCTEVRSLVDGDWCAVVGLATASSLASCGQVPDLVWLSAFLAGSRHLDASHDSTPGDIAWAHIDTRGAAVACGRSGRPFHAREREAVSLLGQILDTLGTA